MVILFLNGICQIPGGYTSLVDALVSEIAEKTGEEKNPGIYKRFLYFSWKQWREDCKHEAWPKSEEGRLYRRYGK